MTRALRSWLAGFLLGCAYPCAGCGAAELTIAAAANAKFALDELVEAFHARHGDIRVKVTYGSSGSFFAQIQNQAPFDLFLSADMEYPRKLSEAGFALESHVFLYAAGRIVVWVPHQSPIDVSRLGIQALVTPGAKKVAIANPRHAPYGAAAIAAMRELQVYDQVEPKLVMGENVAQAAQFVQSGNADVGVLALALVLAPPMRDAGRYWELPAETYPPVQQGGVILKRSQEPAAARAFRDFVLGSSGREVLKRYGFFLPEE